MEAALQVTASWIIYYLKELTFKVDKLGQHIIRYRDDLGIGLETPLGRDHLHELIGDIHV
jgi:hypothetical protein